MPLLYHLIAVNYRRDLDMGAGYHLNQASPTLHRIDIGDSLWAFTRAKDKRYVLAAELVVKAKTFNPPSFRYGRHRVWGHLARSRYFRVDGAPSVEHVVRQLSITARGPVLGRAFQGAAAVRVISLHDHQVLAAFAENLPLEPRARILPEERLEAAMLLGAQEVEQLVAGERPGLAERRRTYLFAKAPARNRRHVDELRRLCRGRCQACGWDPPSRYSEELCEGHHLQWLSRGGEDELSNLALVCPNHHRAVHGCDAPFDFRRMAFDFGTRQEMLKLNEHLGR
jgi:hypothetical protein